MKKNRIILSAVTSIAAILFAGWQLFLEYKTPITQAVNQAVTVISQENTGNYDYNMRDDPIGQNSHSETHYYMLALSWSPGFCDTQRKRFGKNLPNSLKSQCGNGKNFGWIIHGLWPQNKFANSVSEHPRFCQGDLPMVDLNIITKYLSESPSLNLLQGEWEKHGACAFDKAEQYFEKQQKLYRTLVLPKQEIRSRNALFSWVKKNNPQLKNHYLGASRNELFICYGLNWQVIDCPSY